MKANATISVTQPNAYTIQFAVKDAGTFTLDMTKLSLPVRERGLVHGMIQRISDRAAIPRDTKTGASATPAQKLAAMQELAAFYETGTEDWSPSRTARTPVDTTALLTDLLANDPEKLAAIIAAAQAAAAAAKSNATG